MSFCLGGLLLPGFARAAGAGHTAGEYTRLQVPANVSELTTTAYHNAGDNGGARYVRVSQKPSHPGAFQSGDGAWWEIAEQTLYPEQFGAKRDGVSDDSWPFHDFLRSLTALGRPGVMRAGNYLLTKRQTAFQANAPFILTGAGAGKTTLIVSHYEPGLEIQGVLAKPLPITLSGFSIKRLNPDAYQGKLGPKTLFVQHGAGVRISDVAESGAIGFGIHLDHCSDFEVFGCSARDHKNGAQQLSGMDGIHYTNCWRGRVHNNYVENVGDDGISFGSFMNRGVVHRTEDIQIYNNTLRNMAGSIKLYGSVARVDIYNNNTSHCANGGITLWDDRDVGESQNIEDVKIYKNVVDSCGGPGASGGIYVTQPKGAGVQEMNGIEIYENQISNCAFGITVASFVNTKLNKNISIHDNVITNSKSAGILISRASASLSILNNKISNSGLEAIKVMNSPDGDQLNMDIESNTINGWSGREVGRHKSISIDRPDNRKMQIRNNSIGAK